MNVIHQLLVYADHDVSLLGESIQTAKKTQKVYQMTVSKLV